MAPIDTKAQLQALRALMQQHNVDVYIVPAGDSHNSEYIAPCDARRKFLSGFSGTAGTAVVAMDAAVVSTDGRYFNQASQQLDSGWSLLKLGVPSFPTWQEWTAEKAKGGKTVAVDPELLDRTEAEELEQLVTAEGGKFVPLETNLVDAIWGSAQPARSSEPVFTQPMKYTGQSLEDKLAWIRGDILKKKAPGIIINLLDQIAWLFNLRGNDVPNFPVFYSYALVTQKTATIWVDKSRLDEESVANLSANSVEIKPYGEFFADMKSLQPTPVDATSADGNRFLISPAASWRLYLSLKNGKFAKVEENPIAMKKTVKTAEELEGFRESHIRDGAAFIEYFSWLEDQLLNKKATVTEFDGVQKIHEYRSKKDFYFGTSFDTISCAGPNAAIMHYKPELDNCKPIDPNAIYLLDAGAQYLDGTTDCTRTVHFGKPTETEVEVYTRVLKALIALHRAVFPNGSFGLGIDAIARQHLWEYGMNFRHGTSHGVGSFNTVHEGPIRIAQNDRAAIARLAEGNVLSNEPGFYVDGDFGVRIEDMFITVRKDTKFEFGDEPYLGFENLTVVPYCRKLIDTSLLTKPELDWLNAANAYTLEKTKPLLQGNDLALAWLERETQPYQ